MKETVCRRGLRQRPGTRQARLAKSRGELAHSPHPFPHRPHPITTKPCCFSAPDPGWRCPRQSWPRPGSPSPPRKSSRRSSGPPRAGWPAARSRSIRRCTRPAPTGTPSPRRPTTRRPPPGTGSGSGPAAGAAGRRWGSAREGPGCSRGTARVRRGRSPAAFRQLQVSTTARERLHFMHNL